jgi:predicted nuclease of predicted toxin-antitoxin system
VSKDEDFVRLVEQLRPPPQVVWITCGNVRHAELRRIMLAAWPTVAQQLAAVEPLIEVSRLTPG